MTSHKLVFLIGGSDAYDSMADEFLAAAGGHTAQIALLLQGGKRWSEYVSGYVEPWTRRGATVYQPVVPGANGRLNLTRARQILRSATGIFIGGGHTPAYHRLFATDPIRALIRERHDQGVPVAGVSAGALVALQACVLSADETPDKCLQIVPGLDLVRDVVIGVHFTSTNALPEMIEVMAKTRTKIGLGIDDGACAVFDKGRFRGILGQSVYEIEMRDFEKQTFRQRECMAAYSSSR